MVEQPSSVKFLWAHCNIAALMSTDEAKEALVPVRGFNTVLSKPAIQGYSDRQTESIASNILGLAFSSRRTGRNKELKFEDAEVEVQNAGSKWAELLVECMMGLNSEQCQQALRRNPASGECRAGSMRRRALHIIESAGEYNAEINYGIKLGVKG